MGSGNEKRRYIVTSFLIGWSHTENDPCYVVDAVVNDSAEYSIGNATPGGSFSFVMVFQRQMKSHCEDKMILPLCHQRDEISHAGYTAGHTGLMT